MLAAVSLLSACGGANDAASPSEASVLRAGADPEGKAILLTAKESEALAQTQAQQEAAFNQSGLSKSGASSAFKADAVVNQIRFVADFDSDGKDDILWQTTTGATHISFMNGTVVDRCAALGVQTDRIMGTGDFNGDGKADIVWRNMATGAVRISLMDGGTVTSWLNVGATPIALSVKLEAVGDFDGNGRADMLWRNQSTGRSVMSYHNVDGSVLQWPLVSNFIALSTSALKVGDINGDGKDDIVWRNMSSGNVVISLMNGNVATWRGITASPLALSVALEAVGDFDNNGRADLLWRNTRTGNSLMSHHNEDGSVASWPAVSNYINPTSTSAQGVGDFDGDSRDDILWRNLSSGNSVVSLMNGNVPLWVGISFATCPAPVSHTGVTSCYMAGSESLVSCGLEASLLNNQQDGFRSHINPMVYGRVGNHEITSCVQDLSTGLVWEGKTNDDSLRAGGRTYTNYGDGRAGDTSWYVGQVNSMRLCGFADWRLPSANELQSIVNYGATEGARINHTWFPYTSDDLPFFSSAEGSTQDFYSIALIDRHAGRVWSLQPVRLVRGGDSIFNGPRYRHLSVSKGWDWFDNVAEDLKTKLLWRRCVEGQLWTSSDVCEGEATLMTHEAALAHAHRIGWRLPNVKELASLNFQGQGAGVAEDAFPRTVGHHWTSTPAVSINAGPAVWSVNHGGNGNAISIVNGSRFSLLRVRLVRDAP